MTEASTDDADSTDTPTDTSEDIQFNPPDGSDVTIITRADPIRSYVGLITDAIGLDEAQFTFDADGIRSRAVDPANVAMADVSYNADAMSGYDASGNDWEIGVPLTAGPAFKKVLSYGRRRQDDPIRIDIYDADTSQPQIRIAIIRPDQQTKRVTTMFGIDPASIRQEPDIPELKLPYRADPDIDALVDAVQAIKTNGDHAWFSNDDGAFVVGTQPSKNPNLVGDADREIVDSVVFPDRSWREDGEHKGVGDGSLFATDYLQSFVEALQQHKADRVMINFGDEFPGQFDFDLCDHGITGMFMVAPRIRED